MTHSCSIILVFLSLLRLTFLMWSNLIKSNSGYLSFTLWDLENCCCIITKDAGVIHAVPQATPPFNEIFANILYEFSYRKP